MTKLSILFEAIIDGIIAFTDYFVIRKHITLTEALLFTLTAARGFWPIVFGFSPLTTSEVLTSTAVTILFAVVTVLHLASFFLANLWFRIGAIGLGAVLWCVLGMLVAEASIASLAVPSFLTFSGAGAFIVVRLIRDQKMISEQI